MSMIPRQIGISQRQLPTWMLVAAGIVGLAVLAMLVMFATGSLSLPDVIFRPVVNSWVVGTLLVALLAVMIYFGPARSKTTFGQRTTLTALRFGAILVLFMVMLRPSSVYTETRRHPATLVLLVDASRSMQVADMLGDKTRWAELVRQLQLSQPALADLDEDLEVKVYTFDTETRSVPWKAGKLTLPELPEGKESAIGAALREIVQREANRHLAAVLLLSDGTQRALPERDVQPAEPAKILDTMGVRLFTFGFGSGAGVTSTKDVAVKDLISNPTVFVKNDLAVGGNIRIDGFFGNNVPVELLFETSPGKMEVVQSTKVKAEKSGGQTKVELNYVPETPGEYKLTLRAIPQPGELVETNNELSTFVTVLKGGINVLYLEGTPRAEQKYLRWALDAWENIELDYHEIDALSTEPFDADAENWFKPGKYDVIMLGDLDSQAFSKRIADALDARVKAGTGLMMLGGFHSFRAGGYQREPFQSLLPIDMNVKDAKFERQRFGEPIRKDLHLHGYQQMVPTSLGERHYIMLLGKSSENSAIWKKLPPLEGANRFHGVKKLSQVLATNADQKPMLVAHTVGGGRVLAFAGDSTWRWWMRGHQTEHRRFWRQVLLWLSHKDETGDSAVWIKLPQRRYMPGSRVEIRAGAQNPEGDPVTDASFSCEIETPSGKKESLTLHREGTDRAGSFFDTESPGDYKITVRASRGGELLGAASSRFLVQDQDLELDEPRADFAMLEQIATTTQGEFHPPEQLPAVLNKLKQVGLQSIERRETRIDLYDNWPVLMLFVGFLATEWYLRKRWLLV